MAPTEVLPTNTTFHLFSGVTIINLLAPELFFKILAHTVYKT